MKQKQKPLSFSLHPDNHAYIEAVVLKQKETNHRYNRSMYMDDLITHLRTKADAKPKLPSVITDCDDNYIKPPRKPVKRFKAPTVEQVREYCDSRCNNVDAQKFVDHYTVNGWVRGKAETKIKDWKACVRTWEGNDTQKQPTKETLGGNW